MGSSLESNSLTLSKAEVSLFMRCERCGYSSPENHKFCGMCGSRLGPSANAVLIDDNDPLDIETASYRLDDRSASAREPIQFRGRDRRREFARDATRSSGSNGRANYSSATIANLPSETPQEEAAEEVRAPKSTNRSTGIGGPSFLGLGYEGSNDGFVYDKPRDGAFVYDTDVAPPEYLLEEVPRGVSWRAWALFLLLLIGAGLGYIQWRASHHQGFPDVASILARNGPTVDPSGPDMRDNNRKAAPKAQAPAPDSSAPDSAKDTPEQASSSDEGAVKTSSESEDSTPKQSAEAKNASATDKPARTDKTAKADEDAADEASHSKSAKASAAKLSDDDRAESAKPESDGPVAKATKSKRARPAPVEEEAPQPKSLGEKDPLIVQANKYLHARGAGKNCSAAVNLLRQSSSAGNPSADVKLGALYWSGTCVTQSNATAYQWFARAHSLEPQNRWIERSRSSLWASLSSAERRRVGY